MLGSCKKSYCNINAVSNLALYCDFNEKCIYSIIHLNTIVHLKMQPFLSHIQYHDLRHLCTCQEQNGIIVGWCYQFFFCRRNTQFYTHIKECLLPRNVYYHNLPHNLWQLVILDKADGIHDGVCNISFYAMSIK